MPMSRTPSLGFISLVAAIFIPLAQSTSFTTSLRSVSYEPILLQVSVKESSLYTSDNALYPTCPHEGDVTDKGPVLYDAMGQPVWMDTSDVFSGYTCHDANVQTYNEEQYLTVLRGNALDAGYGQGSGLLIDNVFKEVDTGDSLESGVYYFINLHLSI